MKRLIALAIVLLVGCTTGAPQKATSVQDYCEAVGYEAALYAALREEGISLPVLTHLIDIKLGPVYPQREILAMKKVAAWVYGEGMTPKAVELRCIEQRELGVWFTADEWGYHYHDSDPAP